MEIPYVIFELDLSLNIKCCHMGTTARFITPENRSTLVVVQWKLLGSLCYRYAYIWRFARTVCKGVVRVPKLDFMMYHPIKDSLLFSLLLLVNCAVVYCLPVN